MRVLFSYLLISVVISACQAQKTNSPVEYVNPLIGTAPATTDSALKHGENTENNAQVVPYVTAPFGMTNWSPQTQSTEIKCQAPYYYKDSLFQGFRGSHWLSGSCVQDYGSMTLMPLTGALKTTPQSWAAPFTHADEKSTPYHYKLHLAAYQIQAEMTATKRSGMFKFTFENDGVAHILFSLNSDEGQGYVKVNSESKEVVGYNPVHRIYQGHGELAGFSGYFVAQISDNFNDFGTYKGEEVFKNQPEISTDKNIGVYVSFNVKKGQVIYVKVGTSFTSIDAARENLVSETTGLTFGSAVAQLKKTWEGLLGKVQVETEIETDKVKFYTAMYHAFLHPRLFNDVNGDYPKFGGGGEVMNAGNRNYYSDFSMWDTYRASHPLFNFLVPETNADMMYSLLEMAKQGDWLPIFPCWNSYTSAMIGDHVTTSIADAYLKNVIDLTGEQYAYLLKNAFESPATQEEYKSGKGRRALPSYLKYGYVPLEDEVLESFHKREQVSRTLEYAFDDFALSRIATKRGDTKNAAILSTRAMNYHNVYSPADSAVRGVYANGTFIEKYDKYKKVSFITEGTPYQYTWYVPQDVAGLVTLMGGDDGFNRNLDNFHATEQYWHGNEPGHQIPFMYNYAGQPWKTQKLVGEVMQNEYGTGIGGLSGNDDAGQMSAWYVFAGMGFYPVAPSVPEYVISGPRFDKLTIKLPDNKILTIIAKGASSGKNYIQSLTWNGELTDKTFLNHFDINKGGTLVFTMGETPNKNWGVSKESRPYSLSGE
jgi:predicted alpha-1,2-mannosidase